MSEEGAAVSLDRVSIEPHLALLEPRPLLAPAGHWIGEGPLPMT